MKYLIFALVLSLIPSFSSAIFDTGTPIANLKWNSNSRLVWDDFKAKPPRSKSGMVAETQWSWDWEDVVLNGKETIMPVCYFNPHGSWTSVNDLYILNHEQLHFDIGEVFVRKLRAVYLDDPTILNDSVRLNKLFKKYFKMCVEEQRKYDKESNHSILKSKQVYWDKKIKKDLENSKHLDFNEVIK